MVVYQHLLQQVERLRPRQMLVLGRDELREALLLVLLLQSQERGVEFDVVLDQVLQ